MKKIFFTIIIALGFLACTDDFEVANTDHFRISDAELEQDFNLLGSPFQNMKYNLFGDQIEEDLSQDSWVRYVGTPTPFVGGANNTTYNITWNSSNRYWNRFYNNVMSPGAQVIKLANEGGYDVFAAWSKLIQAYGASKLTTLFGPIIYSKHGVSGEANIYDSEQDLYNNLFADLDEIQSVFAANPDYAGLKKFDASYNGDMANWSKLVNSLRLRLAIRISKVAPALAKTQGEKALSDAAGLISDNSEDFRVSLYGSKLRLAVIAFEWGDTRMGAGMESFMVGLKDNRIGKIFAPATDDSLYPEHPDWPYKGIRSGAYLDSKDQRLTYSTPNESFKSAESRRLLSYAEVCFAKAEAALRGWSGAGDAKTCYEDGVRASFASWKADGADAYLADATSTPIDYVDPKESRNNFTSRSDITVAWDEADSNERKLEKIITQKWLNDFNNGNEPWVDHRRTGYPMLPYNAKNDSNADWGVIPADQFLKRMIFSINERNNNASGIADATTKLGGSDLISTRLWWDTGGSNF